MIYSPTISIVLITLLSKILWIHYCGFPKSEFLKSLEDVIQFNSHCHIILLLQQPFSCKLLIRSPSTIQTFSFPNPIEPIFATKDESIYVTRIKGINCIYAIVVQVKSETQGIKNRTTEQLFYYGSPDLDSIHGSWSNVLRISYLFFRIQYKEGANSFLINRMTHVVGLQQQRSPFSRKQKLN